MRREVFAGRLLVVPPRVSVLLAIAALVALGALATGLLVIQHGASTRPVLTVVSRGTPFRSCSREADLPAAEKNSAVEPVSAATGSGVFALWIQDAGLGIRAAIPARRGSGWQRTSLPFTKCTGVGPTYGTDPWVSIGAHRATYATALAVKEVGDSLKPRIVSVRWDWARRSWVHMSTIYAAATTASISEIPLDRPSIAADPHHAGVAYVIFTVFTRGLSLPYISYTADGGARWSRARPIAARPLAVIGLHLTLGGAGQLYEPVKLKTSRGLFLAVLSSRDDGLRWSHPQLVARVFVASNADPGLRRNGALPDLAVENRKRAAMYAAWTDNRFQHGRYEDVLVSASYDGGRRWSRPARINAGSGESFNPRVAINSRGVVGITYYTIREPHRIGSLPTDVWFVQSPDRGAHFSSPLHIAGPFDIKPLSPIFLGDYEGLSTTGEVFRPFFSIATGDRRMPSRIVTTSIQP